MAHVHPFDPLKDQLVQARKILKVDQNRMALLLAIPGVTSLTINALESGFVPDGPMITRIKHRISDVLLGY